MLSFEIPNWITLLSSFFLGLILDAFYDTGGAHAASLVFAAFLRPGLLTLLKPRDGYMPDTAPSIYAYGTYWFLRYAVILIFINNITYFILVKFSFKNFAITLYEAVISSILVLILAVLSLFIFEKNN